MTTLPHASCETDVSLRVPGFPDSDVHVTQLPVTHGIEVDAVPSQARGLSHPKASLQNQQRGVMQWLRRGVQVASIPAPGSERTRKRAEELDGTRSCCAPYLNRLSEALRKVLELGWGLPFYDPDLSPCQGGLVGGLHLLGHSLIGLPRGLANELTIPLELAPPELRELLRLSQVRLWRTRSEVNLRSGAPLGTVRQGRLGDQSRRARGWLATCSKKRMQNVVLGHLPVALVGRGGATDDLTRIRLADRGCGRSQDQQQSARVEQDLLHVRDGALLWPLHYRRSLWDPTVFVYTLLNSAPQKNSSAEEYTHSSTTIGEPAAP